MSHKGITRVLVCPLDWGLGHATRCIPIIRELISKGAEVEIAGEGYGLLLLKEEFPNLPCHFLKGYRISFSSRLPLSIKMLLNIPRIIYRVILEHFQLAELISKNNFDIIISDNRYGLWNSNIHSVFITHQPNIIPPAQIGFSAPLLRRVSRFFIMKYNECWIPDSNDSVNISGNLSHGHSLPHNVIFIGPLSRFDNHYYTNSSNNKDLHNQLISQKFDVIVLLSGPEPQRSRLEEILNRELVNSHLKSLMLRGITGTKNSAVTKNNLTIIDHLPTAMLQSILLKGPVVITRGGYSTLMDLAYTGNKVICIPTPGQTEQEYLAKKGDTDKQLVFAEQSNFSLSKSLLEVAETSGISGRLATGLLTQTINNLLNKSLKNTPK